MSATIMILATLSPPANSCSGYFPGAIVALFILGFLILTLIKPEKF